MNQIINQLKEHRTYRDFDEHYEIPEVELQAILDASRQAPTWMNGQFYSILVVKNKEKREKLVEWNPSNPHMAKSSVFLIFLADYQRTKMVSEAYNSEYHITNNVDALITAVTDAALACENAVVAVESLGLGSVVVGSIRKDASKIIELFDLPEYTVPLFGLSIGKPVTDMQVKPRLPESTVVHYDVYTPYEYQKIEEYDSTMKEFAEARETKLWSKKFSDYLSGSGNPAFEQALKEQKYNS